MRLMVLEAQTRRCNKLNPKPDSSKTLQSQWRKAENTNAILEFNHSKPKPTRKNPITLSETSFSNIHMPFREEYCRIDWHPRTGRRKKLNLICLIIAKARGWSLHWFQLSTHSNRRPALCKLSPSSPQLLSSSMHASCKLQAFNQELTSSLSLTQNSDYMNLGFSGALTTRVQEASTFKNTQVVTVKYKQLEHQVC